MQSLKSTFEYFSGRSWVDAISKTTGHRFVFKNKLHNKLLQGSTQAIRAFQVTRREGFQNVSHYLWNVLSLHIGKSTAPKTRFFVSLKRYFEISSINWFWSLVMWILTNDSDEWECSIMKSIRIRTNSSPSSLSKNLRTRSITTNDENSFINSTRSSIFEKILPKKLST